MDNLINSTQQFDVQNYEDTGEATSTYDGADEDQAVVEYATQAFTAPGTSGYVDGDDDYEEEEDETNPTIQETQAFNVQVGATQAFSVGTFDDAPSDDPMLYDNSTANITIDATQAFSVAEYATVGGNTTVATGANESDYGLPSSEGDGPSFVGGLEVVENDGEYVDERFETGAHEVAVEEVVEDEILSDVGELEMEEIASPDPEEEQGEEEEQEEDEEQVADVRRANRISSEDDEDEDEDAREGGDEGPSTKSKPSKVYVNEDDDGSDRAGGVSDDDPDAEKKSDVGELIANIFGDSDDEGAASDTEEAKAGQSSRQARAAASDSETKDSDEANKLSMAPDFVSDFDMMMERRKAENRRRYRKRKDFDVVNDSDDVINELITQMKHAAKADIELNKEQKPALTKRKLLPTVVKQLKKSDLQSAFIELGVITVIADWLSPLPDGSLPALEIRTEMLKVLQQFPTLDHQILKSSSIGRAVMILYKHPKEVKENKERAGKLINEWARPIFSLQSDYRSLSKEERIQRDYEHMPAAKKRRMSSLDAENKPKAPGEEATQLRPGDKGWIGRARVPQPSTKDYVVRPKWNVEQEFKNVSNKRSTSLMDRKIREIKERTKPKKAQRAVGVSIEGRKMAF